MLPGKIRSQNRWKKNSWKGLFPVWLQASSLQPHKKQNHLQASAKYSKNKFQFTFSQEHLSGGASEYNSTKPF